MLGALYMAFRIYAKANKLDNKLKLCYQVEPSTLAQKQDIVKLYYVINYVIQLCNLYYIILYFVAGRPSRKQEWLSFENPLHL